MSRSRRPGGDPYPWFSGSRLSPNQPTIRTLEPIFVIHKTTFSCIGFSARARVRNCLLCRRDYRLIRRELGSVFPGCGLRLPLVAELKRPVAEFVLDCAHARVAG